MRWIRLLSAAGLVAATLLTPVAVAAPADHDPMFGTAGVVMTDVRTTGSSDYVNDLVLQPDGKLVAVGRSSNTGGVDGCPVFALTLENCGNANNNWSLARYNPDGSLDSSFAISGRGTVTLDTFNFGNGELSAVATRPDGTIVAVGERASLLSEPARDNLHGAIVLFAANGAPLAHVALPAFGDGSAQTRLADVALQPDGKIVVAGTRQPGGTNDGNMLIARLNADLSLDTSFGSGGLATVNAAAGQLDEARALALQADGKIVAAGYATPGAHVLTLARLTATGALDGTFGNGGLVMGAPAAQSEGRSLALQPDGKIVVGGLSSGGLAVFRYLADGTPDGSFGTAGAVMTDVGVPAGINDVVVQANGKIAAVGNNLSLHDSGEVEVVRYNADGSLDAGFGTGGIVREFTGSWSVGNSLVAQPDGRLVFGGLIRKTIGAADSSDYVLVRYLGDLATPPTAPDVALTIVDSSDPVAARDLLTYTLRIVNEGSATATDVGLSADLPRLGFDSVSQSQGSCRRRGLKLTCELGSIAPSAAATVTIAGTARGKQEVLELRASVGTPGDADPVDNSAVEQTTVQ